MTAPFLGRRLEQVWPALGSLGDSGAFSHIMKNWLLVKTSFLPSLNGTLGLVARYYPAINRARILPAIFRCPYWIKGGAEACRIPNASRSAAPIKCQRTTHACV